MRTCLGNVVIGIMLIILALVVYGRWFYKPTYPDPLADTVARQITAEEQKVLAAFINEADVMYAYVLDDGTRRDGYACYLCQTTRPRYPKLKKVKVLKAGSQEGLSMGVVLGECACSAMGVR